jgi:hypothetical protein
VLVCHFVTFRGVARKASLEGKGEAKLTDRCDKSPLVLLSRQHENGEDQLRSKKHLYEQSLHHTRPSSQRRLNIQPAGEHTLHQRTRYHTSQNLAQEQQSASDPRQSTDEAHAESDRWVEEAAGDSEEHPGVDGEREAKGEGYVLQLLRVGACLGDGQTCGGRDAVGYLGAGQGEPEEEDCADEFAAHCLGGAVLVGRRTACFAVVGYGKVNFCLRRRMETNGYSLCSGVEVDSR